MHWREGGGGGSPAAAEEERGADLLPSTKLGNEIEWTTYSEGEEATGIINNLFRQERKEASGRDYRQSPQGRSNDLMCQDCACAALTPEENPFGTRLLGSQRSYNLKPQLAVSDANFALPLLIMEPGERVPKYRPFLLRSSEEGDSEGGIWRRDKEWGGLWKVALILC